MSLTHYCPHCGSRAKVTGCEQITRITRELHYACRNTECGHTYVALLQAIRTISPSAIPHPEITLPFSKRAKARICAHFEQVEKRGLLKEG